MLLFTIVGEVCLFTVSKLDPESWLYLMIQAGKCGVAILEYQKLTRIDLEIYKMFRVFGPPFGGAFVFGFMLQGQKFRTGGREENSIGDLEKGNKN